RGDPRLREPRRGGGHGIPVALEARHGYAHPVRAVPRARRHRLPALGPRARGPLAGPLPGVNVIGLTGGIGSGTTTLAGRFDALGASIVDTDEISRSLTTAGGAALAALRAEFGEAYFRPDGALDREAMRTLAFEDPKARARLEAVLHPAIRKAADSALASA